MEFIDLNLPFLSGSPERGRLLIAQPLLKDPNFKRTVLLLCEHDIDGSVGFVLNQPTEYSINELIPEIVASNLKVFQGRPVQTNTLHIVHCIPEILGGKEIGNGIFWGGNYESMKQMLNEGGYDKSSIRLFAGYSGWTQGQLESEIKDKSWITGNISREIIFNTEHDEIWKKSIAELGKQYSYLLNIPVDPQSN